MNKKLVLLSIVLSCALIAPSSLIANIQAPSKETVQAFIKRHPKKLVTAAGIAYILALTTLGSDEQKRNAVEAFGGFLSSLLFVISTDKELSEKPFNSSSPHYARAGALLGFSTQCYGIYGFYKLIDIAASKL